MADRIIKGDSGNDVIVQNNSGSRKIEVTNSGDVEVTGDFKATTVKATNLKANDGTASLEVADSTGDIGFSGNTNLKIKLPSAGGIYESDGSTEVLTESGGVATFKGTIGANATFPSNTIIDQSFVTLSTSINVTGTATTDVLTGTIDTVSTSDYIIAIVCMQVELWGNNSTTAPNTKFQILDNDGSTIRFKKQSYFIGFSSTAGLSRYSEAYVVRF